MATEKKTPETDTTDAPPTQEEKTDELVSKNNLPKTEGGAPADILAEQQRIQDPHQGDETRRRIMEEPGHGEGRSAEGQVADTDEAREENEKEYEARLKG